MRTTVGPAGRLVIMIMSALLAVIIAASGWQPAAAEDGAQLSGTIMAPDGAGIPGAEAELCEFDSSDTPIETGRVGTADADGRFKISNVPDGDYTFLFRDPASTVQNGTRFFIPRWYGDVKALGSACWENPQSDAGRFTVADGKPVEGLDGTLPIGGRIVGHTNDTRGEPVDDMQVLYTDAAGFEHSVRSGWPSGGEYRTMLVEPGEQDVRFFDGRDSSEITKTVTVEPGKPTRLDADFARDTLDPLGTDPLIKAPRTLAKGELLEIEDDWYHANATSSYVWLRDGKPIKGARDKAYRLTAKDAGHTIGARVTASLKGHESLTVAAMNTVELKEQDSETSLMLAPASAPKDNPSVIHAYVHVNLESGDVPSGTVTIWDDSHGEEEGRHIELGSGSPNELGDLMITFPADLELDGGEAYAEFVPEDPTINASYSTEIGYIIG